MGDNEPGGREFQAAIGDLIKTSQARSSFEPPLRQICCTTMGGSCRGRSCLPT